MDRVRTSRAALAHLAEYGTPPDRKTAKNISVGLDGALSRFKSEVFPYLLQGGTEIQFVFGANGRGKTHYLLSVEEAAREEGFVVGRVDCAIGASPFQSLRMTYEMVATALMPPSPLALDGESGITAIIRAAISPGSPWPVQAVLESIRSSRHLSPDFRNVVLAYARGLHSESLTERLREDLEALLMGSQTRQVTVGAMYKSDHNLPRPLGRLTSKNAAIWLRSLLSLPGALGFPGGVILFDETERAFHGQTRSAMQEQLAHLRNLVDYCALGTFGGCLILYAAAEDFIDLARQNLDALAQRIEPPSLLRRRLPTSIRSVWTDLDDLTHPRTDDTKFFTEVSDRILALGSESGLTATRVGPLRQALSASARKFAVSPTSSVVRQFVKQTAAAVLTEISRNG